MERSRHWHKRSFCRIPGWILKGEEMSEKSDVKVPEEIRKGWEEARLCANLIREGKAKIMIATRKDGTTYRYTKPK